LKKYLIDNNCKLVNDEECRGMVLDCKLTNEHRSKTACSSNNNNNNSKPIIVSGDKKRKGFSDNIYDSIKPIKKQKKKNKSEKGEKKKKVEGGMTERSKPRPPK
jgi:hypothetical protein